MSEIHTVFPKKEFSYLLLILGAIGGSLVAIFAFIATAQVGEALAFVLFLIVGALLISGYMFGLIFLGLAIIPVVDRVRGRRDQRSVPPSS